MAIASVRGNTSLELFTDQWRSCKGNTHSGGVGVNQTEVTTLQSNESHSRSRVVNVYVSPTEVVKLLTELRSCIKVSISTTVSAKESTT